MNCTSLIADCLTIIRNANRNRKEKTDVPASRMIKSVLEILKNEGYIEDFKPLEEGVLRRYRVYLKFGLDNNPVISGLKLISKPSLRVYKGYDDLPRVLNGQGIAVISTPKGMLTNNAARLAKIGGEVICYVW